MGTTYEWHHNPTVTFLSAGDDIRGEGPIGAPDIVTDGSATMDALVISSNEAAVVYGDLDLFLRRVLHAMPGLAPLSEYRLLYQGRVVHEGWDSYSMAEMLLEARVIKGYVREDHRIEVHQRWSIDEPWREA